MFEYFNNKTIVPFRFSNERMEVIDQKKLPNEELWIKLKTIDDCYHAIRDMVVRGAPLIGLCGIWGVVLWFDVLKNTKKCFTGDDLKRLSLDVEKLKSARPTAVNLSFEIEQVKSFIATELKTLSYEDIHNKLIYYFYEKYINLEKSNLLMAQIGFSELTKKYGKKKLNLMTICNTGALACGPPGTALGVIDHVFKIGNLNKVYVPETRPYLQGSRLTSYELIKGGIDHEVIVEGALSYVLENCNIDAIFVGADRIASNGDTANKIGTSTLSILAKFYKVPFYVVAPLSSFDFNLKNGDNIDIEIRDENEILKYQTIQVGPVGAKALNPSFDITRADNITGIICEKEIISPVNFNNMERLNRGLL